MHPSDDLGPLPLIRERESILANRCLVEHEGIPYWSRIYDGGEVIFKQTTLDLAEREAFFLSRLQGPHFPRVLNVQTEPLYSVAVLEKIKGVNLLEVIGSISETVDSMHGFITHCLAILNELAKNGITHRDIRPDNILVRDQKPVLMDLGWAISDTKPCFTPKYLGGIQRPVDGSFSDVYSMGKVLEAINQDRFEAIGSVIELMTESSGTARLTDLNKLRVLFDVAANSDKKNPSKTETEDLIHVLLQNISRRNRTISALQSKNAQHVSELEQSKTLLDKTVEAHNQTGKALYEKNLELTQQQQAAAELQQQLELTESRLTESVRTNQTLSANFRAELLSKDQDLSIITVNLQKAQAEIAENRKMIAALQGQEIERISQLAETVRNFEERTILFESEIERKEAKIRDQETELQIIKSGAGWAVLEEFWKARLRVAPRGSRREHWMNQLLRRSASRRDSTTKKTAHSLPGNSWRSAIRDRTPQAMRQMYRRLFPATASIPKTPKEFVETQSQPETQKNLWLAEHPPVTYDVIVFPIIDWDFRFQRPQQLSVRFAESGHRVFYLTTRFCDAKQPAFRVLRENILELMAVGPTRLNIYEDCLEESLADSIALHLAGFFQEFSVKDALCIVDLPFWSPVAFRLREKFGWKIVYDCMDWHSGFSTNRKEMLEQEKDLSERCDLLLTTSRKLYADHASHNARCFLVPNAVDFDHFHFTPEFRPAELDNIQGPIIGYYGAISDWFDSDLISTLAAARPEWNFVLIGHTFGADLRPLSDLKNVHQINEVPYANLPAYLHHFDVCMIPFKKTPLTEATNPVKLFEYLAAGKRVVASDLMELGYYADYVKLASTPEQWLESIEASLAPPDPNEIQQSIEYARQNTWEHRASEVKASVTSLYPKASIVVVTYNNLDYNRLCLESIFSKTIYPNFEVIVVDNDSNDGTADFLLEFAQTRPQVKVIANQINRGFAAANNQGLKEANGEYIVFLNNDTVVTRGWLPRLIYHLRDPEIGMVGPVTNWSGNESRIATSYESLDRLEAFAEDYANQHFGRTFEIKMLALFCVALRRDVFEQVGALDERYGIGMFEDDDYAYRVREKGYKIICAEDVFIHHWGRASFSKLPDDEYRGLFDNNREKFEQKWKTKWEPHQYRTS